MLLIWCVHSACDPIFGQRPTINSLYVQLWLRTYMCSTTKSQLHLTWLEVWWSLGSYPSMFHHAMRGDTLSHSIETIIWLMMIIWSDPSMFHDAVSPWSLHIYHYEAMQGQGPHFPPTRKATIHIHRGEGGKGVKMGTLHWGGVGGGLAKPGSYIYKLYTRYMLYYWHHCFTKTTFLVSPQLTTICPDPFFNFIQRHSLGLEGLSIHLHALFHWIL